MRNEKDDEIRNEKLEMGNEERNGRGRGKRNKKYSQRILWEYRLA